MFSLPIKVISAFVAGFLVVPISALPSNTGTQSTNPHDDERNNLKMRSRGLEIPIKRSLVRRSNMRRRGTVTGESGLGDSNDL
jgi:hypothetical protein